MKTNIGTVTGELDTTRPGLARLAFGKAPGVTGITRQCAIHKFLDHLCLLVSQPFSGSRICMFHNFEFKGFIINEICSSGNCFFLLTGSHIVGSTRLLRRQT
jgi:hypothetical protein